MGRPKELKISKTINAIIEVEQYKWLIENNIPISKFFRAMIEDYRHEGHVVRNMEELKKENKELKQKITELEDEVIKYKPKKRKVIEW